MMRLVASGSRSPSKIEARVGAVICGRYQLLNVLGVGGMGAVYEAIHVITQRKLAVKLMHSTQEYDSPIARSRFVREAQAAASIEHPGLVDVLDAGVSEEGALYMALELLHGIDLEAALRSDGFRVGALIEVVMAVLAPLAAAHARGFVHRDIKPANIFLCDRGEQRVKLLDFGVAKRSRPGSPDSGITAHGSILGTLDFMGPEQAAGETVDHRSDLWSLGAVLYYGLCGRPPFVADSTFELLRRIVCADVPPLERQVPNLPHALVNVVHKALSRDPAERFASAAQMTEALGALRLGAAAQQPVLGRVPVVPLRPLADSSDPTDKAPVPTLITAQPMVQKAPIVAELSPKIPEPTPEVAPQPALQPAPSFPSTFSGQLDALAPRRWPRVVLFAIAALGVILAVVLQQEETVPPEVIQVEVHSEPSVTQPPQKKAATKAKRALRPAASKSTLATSRKETVAPVRTKAVPRPKRARQLSIPPKLSPNPSPNPPDPPEVADPEAPMREYR